jgi:tripartite-type tricarboxylate transporter receptor subunit TctC
MGATGKLTALIVAALTAGVAAAQSWPNRPIRVLVGYPPGGSADLVPRVVAGEIGKALGQAVVIENRPGAGGQIAIQAIAKSTPDGYTLLAGGPPLNTHPIFLKNDTVILGKDLTPLGDVSWTPLVLIVRANLGIRTYDELVAHAKKNPGKLNYGSISSLIDLVMEMVRRKSGFTYTSIQYKGTPVQEMLRDEVDFYLGTMSGIGPYVQAGKISPILFFGRYADYPNAQLATDLGLIGRPLGSRIGFYGPARLPEAVVARFSNAALTASNTPEVMDGLRKLGLQSQYQSPGDQQRDYEAYLEIISEAARLTGFKPQ